MRKSKVFSINEIDKVFYIKYKDVIFKVLLDEEDFHILKKYNWNYRCGYVSRNRNKQDEIGGSWIHLHREVFKNSGIAIPDGMIVDHINRNKMDNRRCNLRIVSQSENALNVSQECLEKRAISARKATEISASLPRTEKQTYASSAAAKKINSSGKNIHIGKDNCMSKKIINIETKKTFDSIKEASIFYNKNYSTLKSQINGNNVNKTSLMYYSEFLKRKA